MTYQEAIAQYTLPNGIVTLESPPKHSDNPFLFQATHISVLSRLGCPIEGAKESLATYLAERVAASPGGRLPLPEQDWGYGNISHDEIAGLAYSGYSPMLRKAAPWWIFNSIGEFKANFYGWYYRFGYLVAPLKAMAGEKPNWFDRLRYKWACDRISKLSYQEPDINTSSRCLMLLMTHNRGYFPASMRQDAERFLDKCTEQFGDISGLYSVYFGKNHPFAVYTKGVKFR